MKPVAIIQNCEIESAGTIRDYLRSKEIPYTETHTYRGEKLPAQEEFGTLISLGTPLSIMNLNKHKFLSDLFKFKTKTVELGKPILGICAGAQMLALVLGAKVTRNKVKEIGISNVTLTDLGVKDAIFDGFQETFPVFQWHGDTFSIPGEATHLTRSDHCHNQAFRKDNLIGLQFHLEANPKEVPLWCEAYIEELSGEGLDKDQIISDTHNHAEQLRTLSFNLLDNFFSLI